MLDNTENAGRSPLRRVREALRGEVARRLVYSDGEAAGRAQRRLRSIDRRVARWCLKYGMEAGHARANKWLAGGIPGGDDGGE